MTSSTIGPSAGARAGAIRSTRLDNGITIVTETMTGVSSVSIGFWVGAGSRDEDPAIAGVSHFLEHLLFKGTESRSALDISEAIESVGGEINAYTTKEHTAYYVRLLDADLDLGLDILSDIIWAPAFRVDEIEAERQVILEEILMHEDEPSDLVHDVFAGALFSGHPLGREVLGNAGTIEPMTRDQIVEYFSARYRPSSMVVAAAGNLDHDRVVDGIQARFAGPDGGAPPRHTGLNVPPRPLAVAKRATEQGHLVVGMRSLSAHDDDRFALSILNHILGGGMSSRLFQEIREKRGLAYSVYSYRSGDADAGRLAIYAGTSPSRTQEVLAVVGEQLDALAADGITERELKMAKSHLVGSLALGLEDPASRMSLLGRGTLVHGEALTYDQIAARTQAVTMDDVARVVGRVLGEERVLAVVGPFDERQFVDRVA
jgi:predicted Zn-dependent peptidase